MPHFQKNVAELRAVASMFWPEEFSQEAAKLSVVPLLLNTQDQFLSILGVDVPDIAQLFVLLEAAELPANLFLKHLMILADFGGEILQRVNDNFSMLFPDGKIEYEWKNRIHSYQFQQLPVKGRLNNAKLGVSGKKLTESIKLNGNLPGISHTNRDTNRPTTFDIVVSKMTNM